jgi:transposase-like protein
VPTGIWRSRWRSGCAHWDLDCEEEAVAEEAEEVEEAEAEEEEENSSDKI